MKEEPLEKGKVQTFGADLGQVVDTARESMVSAKLTMEEAYQPEDGVWVLLGKKCTSFWSWGELVRVVIDDQDQSDDGVRVRVITNRKGD